MSPSFKLTFSAVALLMFAAMMSAHADIMDTRSIDNPAVPQRGIPYENLNVQWRFTGVLSSTDGWTAFLTPLIFEQTRYLFLQPCCGTARFTQSSNLQSADLDALSYLDSGSPSADFGDPHTYRKTASLKRVNPAPTSGPEPYVMLIAGLGLLGLAISLHRKTENKESEAISFASHFSRWRERELRRPRARDVPSGFKFT